MSAHVLVPMLHRWAVCAHAAGDLSAVTPVASCVLHYYCRHVIAYTSCRMNVCPYTCACEGACASCTMHAQILACSGARLRHVVSDSPSCGTEQSQVAARLQSGTSRLPASDMGVYALAAVFWWHRAAGSAGMRWCRSGPAPWQLDPLACDGVVLAGTERSVGCFFPEAVAKVASAAVGSEVAEG